MGNEQKRKRIPIIGVKGTPAIEDDKEFTKNRSSDNARKIGDVAVSIATHLWMDKHLHYRQIIGDNDGQRPGIEPEIIENIVKKAIPHLLFYSTAVKGFSFLNYNNPKDRPIKIVLKEDSEHGMLNVVIEVHYADEIGKFEITVKTAMCIDDFSMFMGQFAIEFQGDSSFLLRKDNSGLIEICQI